jgi:hypothetical protein
MGSTRAKWRGNQLAFFDNSTYETARALAPRVLIEDFEGDTLNTDKWLYAETANEDTQAVNGGNAVLTFTNDATQQEAGVIAAGNSLDWDISKGLIIEFRARLSVLPTGTTEAHLGILGQAQADDSQICAADEYAEHAVFSFDGNGICIINTDDGTNEGTGVATGVTVIATDMHIYRIDFTDDANVLFYIDGVGVATTTTFMMDDIVSPLVQPFVNLTKSAAAGVGTLLLDYIKIWQATR